MHHLATIVKQVVLLTDLFWLIPFKLSFTQLTNCIRGTPGVFELPGLSGREGKANTSVSTKRKHAQDAGQQPKQAA